MAPTEDPSIIIVGAGIAGLYTSLELHRNGFRNIHIVERAKRTFATGDYFAMNASSLSTFHLYPDMFEEYKIQVSHEVTFKLFSGEHIYGPTEAEWNQPGCVHAAKVPFLPMVVHRPTFFEMVLKAVERRGIKISWSTNVVNFGEDVDNNVAWAELKDGTKLKADLVVAADGIGTKSHMAVTGKAVEAYSSGYAVLRTTTPTDIILKSQYVREHLGWDQSKRAEFRTYLAPGQHFVLVLSPKYTTIFYTHKDNGSASESWSTPVPSKRMEESMIIEVQGWDPVLIEVSKQIPEGNMIDWRLMWRDPQPKWTSDSGRILQVGDSAHSFLPTSGNGASQGVEDALSLAACLVKAGGNVPNATKVHNLLRFERVSTIQQKGFTRRQDFHHAVDPETGKLDPNLDIKLISGNGKWLWTHKPAEYAFEKFDAALDHLENGTPFENTNLPPGFKYKAWTIEEQLEKEEKGELVHMGGDWS